MHRTLGWIAAIGLIVGVVSLSLAWAVGGRDFRRLLADTRFDWRSCDDTKVAVGGPERRLPWTGGDAIRINLATPLTLIAGDGTDVILRGPAEAIAHLQVSDGRLFADCRWPGSATIEVELPSRALRDVRLAGSGRVALEKLNQPELALTISGSGRVQARGTVERVVATVSGSGDVRLADVALKRLTTKISGSGSLEAGPKDEADITLSGSGHVRLLTRPASLHSKVAGSGRIIQPGVEAADRK
jgi:hypothetical protein